MRFCFLAVAAFFFACPAARAQVDPASLPAHDSHENFLVACDPYTDPARAEARLGKKNPLQAGILPLEVFFRNSGDQAIRVNLDTIRLVVTPPGESHQDLEPLAVEDVVARMLSPKGPPDVTVRRMPSPFPKIGHGKKWDQLEEKLRPLSLEVGVVAPGSTVHGFLFFDMNHQFDLVARSHLYVPGAIRIGTNQQLMFFEVELSPAASH